MGGNPPGTKPAICVVPAYFTAGFFVFFYHFYLSVVYLLGLGSGSDDNWSVRRPNNKIIAQSCRSIFATVWQLRVPKDAKVLVSPYHHHSFMRMMWKTGQELTVMDAHGTSLVPPEGKGPFDFGAVVVTQMMGRDYDWDWLKVWKKENPALVIIEDRVQGGLLSQGNTDIPDISLYSLGQDKLPNAMGGGYALVHRDTQLYEDMVASMEAMPFESSWERFMFLVKKLPTVFIYNTRIGAYVIERLAHYAGLDRNQLTDTYRKKNPGFMHGGYMIRPSPAQVRSIDAINADEYWEALQVRCAEQFRKFLNHIPDDLKEDVKVCGSPTACCYFFIRVPDLAVSRPLLAKLGIITISNQTFLPASDAITHHIENMITLPSFLPLTDEEIKRVADAVVEAWRTCGPQE